MTDIELVKDQDQEKAVEKLLQMDVNDLSIADRQKYLWWMAVRRGLDPLTKPFDCIPDGKGKLILFANSGCADQLRQRNGISLEVVEEGFLRFGETLRDDVYYVKVKAKDQEGRSSYNIGAVGVKGFVGETMANAMMKAHTKAGRRTTLDLCGLGIPDVSELDSIPNLTPKATLTEPRRIVPAQPTTSLPQGSVDVIEAVVASQTENASPTPPRRYPPAVPPIKVK